MIFILPWCPHVVGDVSRDPSDGLVAGISPGILGGRVYSSHRCGRQCRVWPRSAGQGWAMFGIDLDQGPVFVQEVSAESADEGTRHFG